MASAVQRARHEQRRVASIGFAAGTAPPAAVGGAALLEGEANGFATDFTHAVDAERVAVKTAGAVVSSPLSFFTSAGTSSKWVCNAAGVLVNVPAGTLPLDYDPVTHAARGLLCEPQATNLLADSNGFGGASGWTVGSLTMPKNATGPMGANTAFTLTMTAGTGSKWFYNGGGLSGNLVWSIYAKAGTLSWVAMGEGGGSPANAAFFNVSAGTVGTVTGRFSAGAIQAVGNGWYRCSAIVTAAAGFFDVQPHSADNQGIGWTATGGETLFISAGQAETGTVATSPIITPPGASATRAVDQYNFTSASINYSATAGSWWVDATPIALTGYPIIGFANGSASPSKVASSTTLALFDGTNTQKTVANSLAAHKTAAAYAAGDRAFTADGLTVQVDSGSTTNLLNPGTIGLGNTPGVGASTGMMYIRKLRYVPRRKTNLELATESA